MPQDPPAPQSDAAAAAEPSTLSVALRGTNLLAEAKALLMESRGIDASEAFELLRHYSRLCDLPLRDVAAKLVHEEWVRAE